MSKKYRDIVKEHFLDDTRIENSPTLIYLKVL